MTPNTSAQNARRHDSNQHTQGLALCHRVILDSVTHPWVHAGHPRYTGARTRDVNTIPPIQKNGYGKGYGYGI